MNRQADFAVHSILAPILETVLDAVVVMTVNGEVCGWNKVAEQVFGWPSHEAKGRMLADLIIPEIHRAAHAEGLRRLAEGGTARVLNRRIEITALCQDGREIPIELSITTALNGPDLVFMGFIRDISERRAAEARTERQALETCLMFEISDMAAESDSFESALAKALEAICKITGWPVGHAFVVPAGNPNLIVSSTVWHEAQPGLAEAFRKATDETVFGPNVGLPGRIMQSGGPLWISDTATDPNFPRRVCGFLGAFGFPLKHDGKIVAILEFFSQSKAPPEPELLLTVRALGEQVGRVFERKRTQDQQQLLVKELNHRVKNILSVVHAIAQQTFGRASSIDDAYNSFRGRLMAVARAQDILVSEKLSNSTLEDVIKGALRGSGLAEDRVTMSGPSLVVSARNAVSVSLGIHELCTNAFKYGSLSVESGSVSVTWGEAISDGHPMFVFEWREKGGPPVVPPHKKGFGTNLLERGLAAELGGKIDIQYDAAGLICRFSVPMPAAQVA